MKHSAALDINEGDLLAWGLERNGTLWEVVRINFPWFHIKELLTPTTSKPSVVNYMYLHKPTKAQLNAYNKRKEKYYENSTETGTSN